MPDKPLVIILTLVYNHAPYLHDYFKGILMQKTDFPFYAVVHDDASTDGSADIIREYAEKHPDIIRPIYETENQYSKTDGSLGRILLKAQEGAKYVALCEGDDYWIDPYKLQKQIDWMEEHPDCSMTCSRGEVSFGGVISEEAEKARFCCCYTEDRDLTTEEIIIGGGGYLHTPTLVYRNGIHASYPPECRQCHVGDYPLQIMAALTGTVHYFADKTAVYRALVPNSWSACQQGVMTEYKAVAYNSEMRMLSACDRYSQGKYHSVFHDRQVIYLTSLLRRYPKQRALLLKHMGWVLREVPEEKPGGRCLSFLRRVLHHIFFAYPVYRYDISEYMRTPIRWFYSARPGKISFGLGRRHVMTIYEADGKKYLNFCGHRVWTFRKA